MGRDQVARKRSRTTRPATPRPRPGARAPEKAPRRATPAPVPPTETESAIEDRWTASYAYVKKDLTRIAVLAIVLFAVIVISPVLF